MIDLGLSYEEAAHGIQTAITVNPDKRSSEPKHLRVGVDLSKSDMFGLVELLISKGVFTVDEYLEHIRLAANTELHHRQKELGGNITCR